MLMTESEEELKSLLMKLKEESEKVDLKLNIQKTMIMASGPITSWQIDEETITVAAFFWGAPKSLPEKAVAPHSSTLAWKIRWMEEPGRPQSMLRVGHDFTFTFTFPFHALEKEMATHSRVLAWRIPGMGEPGGLPSMGSHRVRHD